MITVKQIQDTIQKFRLTDDAVLEFNIMDGLPVMKVKTPDGIQQFPTFKTFNEILADKIHLSGETIVSYENAANEFAAQFGVFGTYPLR